MTLSIQAIIAIWLLGYVSACFALGGVALGGFLVYRTKREPHEGFVGSPTKGEASYAGGQYVEDDLEDLSWGRDVTKGESSASDDVLKQTDKFLRQTGQDRV